MGRRVKLCQATDNWREPRHGVRFKVLRRRVSSEMIKRVREKVVSE